MLMLSRIVFVEVCICTFIVARYPIFFYVHELFHGVAGELHSELTVSLTTVVSVVQPMTWLILLEQSTI